LAKNFSNPLIQGLPKKSSKGLILYNSHISACGKSHVWKDTLLCHNLDYRDYVGCCGTRWKKARLLLSFQQTFMFS
jgi:hypothetical protein